jgi:hypothetical protein
MSTCPRCGSQAEILAGELYVLVRCDVCDDVIDTYDLGLAEDDPAPAAAHAGA